METPVPRMVDTYISILGPQPPTGQRVRNQDPAITDIHRIPRPLRVALSPFSLPVFSADATSVNLNRPAWGGRIVGVAEIKALGAASDPRVPIVWRADPGSNSGFVQQRPSQCLCHATASPLHLPKIFPGRRHRYNQSWQWPAG